MENSFREVLKMDETKLQELIEDENFAKNVLESKTPQELESVLSKKGLKVSSEELEQIIKSLDLIKSQNLQAKDSKTSEPIPISDEESAIISGGGPGNNNFENDQPSFTNENVKPLTTKQIIGITAGMTGITSAVAGAPFAMIAAILISNDYHHWKGERKWRGWDTSFKTYWKMCKIKDIWNNQYTPYRDK